MAAKAVATGSMPDCHGMSSNAGCVTQWTSPDQSVAHATVAVYEAPAAAILDVPVAKLSAGAACLRELISPTTGDPPPPIRFCSLLL